MKELGSRSEAGQRRAHRPAREAATQGGLDGALFDIELVLELGEAETVGLDIRGQRIEYSAAAQELTALGSRAPLSAEDGRITLRILVDRTSVEVFANHGRVQLANCFVPAEDSSDLTLRATGGPATALSLAVWELRSIWKDKAQEPLPHH